MTSSTLTSNHSPDRHCRGRRRAHRHGHRGLRPAAGPEGGRRARARPWTPATVWSSTASRSPTSSSGTAAEAEGSLNLYTGYTENTEAALLKQFTADTGIKVNVVRLTPNRLLRADLRRVRRRQD